MNNQEERVNFILSNYSNINYTKQIKGKSLGGTHNIWNNNGTWWIYFFADNENYMLNKLRVRVSLKTKNIKEAKTIRNELFNQLQNNELD